MSRIQVDSLSSEGGGFAPLHVSEFKAAFVDAGAVVSKGSASSGKRFRSFTVSAPAAGAVRCSLAIQLGRGLNSLECRLSVFVVGEQVGDAKLIHVVARRIRIARGGDAPDPAAAYPRPIIGSRSHLEVVSKELVDVMERVARDWDAG